MNKRVASSILKKYNDESTRKEAVDLAKENEYILNIQIENGVETLVSVSHEGTLVSSGELEGTETDTSELLTATPTPAPPAPEQPSKKTSQK